MMAIGHAAKTIASQLNIEYLTLDEYVEAFHAAIAAGQGDAFRRRSRMSTFCWWTTFIPYESQRDASELLRLTERCSSRGIRSCSQRSPACRNRRSGPSG